MEGELAESENFPERLEGHLTRYWQVGDHVVLREIWRGRVWAGRPYTVVEDRASRLVLYSRAGGWWMRPARTDGTVLRVREPGWVLREDAWAIEVLRIVTPGSGHSLLLLWTAGFGELLLWYVNLEEPLKRTAIGFDYLDQLLDIEIAVDLSSWKWKDEDELEAAVERGVMTPEDADRVREEGEKVIAALDAGESPFDEPWERWRPDPGWTAPGLPDGWSDLCRYPARGGDFRGMRRG